MDHAPALPPPPREASRRAFIALVVAVAVLVLSGAGIYWVHLDSYAVSPGPAEDVGRLVSVRGERTYTSRGAFLLTTVSVSVDRVTVVDGLRAWLDPEVELVDRSRLVQPGFDDEQQEALNRLDMEQSKYAAEVVALQASGLNVVRIPGARVIGVFPKAPATGRLKAADVIVAVDGKAATTARSVSDLIRSKPVGSSVRLEVLRASQRETITLKTAPAPEDPRVPVIGVSLAEAFRIPVEISINSLDIVGPSGGLVFTLAIADALTPDDLTGGHRVAATGTIALDGTVGEIGGVAQKVRAAERVGADIFIVPASEAGEARKAARSVRIYGVSTVREAVEILSALRPAKAA
jgi:PDZ domain-containing protein